MFTRNKIVVKFTRLTLALFLEVIETNLAKLLFFVRLRLEAFLRALVKWIWLDADVLCSVNCFLSQWLHVRGFEDATGCFGELLFEFQRVMLGHLWSVGTGLFVRLRGFGRGLSCSFNSLGFHILYFLTNKTINNGRPTLVSKNIHNA